jgi:hypothetical protein
MIVDVSDLKVSVTDIEFRLSLTTHKKFFTKQFNRQFINFLPWDDFKAMWLHEVLWVTANQILCMVTTKAGFFKLLNMVHVKLTELFSMIETLPKIKARKRQDAITELKLSLR